MALNQESTGVPFIGLETRIEEAIKCQVCKKQVCWPVVVCYQGHGSCLKCKKSHSECCICKGPLLPKPPSLLKNLLQILPKRCKYYKMGCLSFEYIYENHDELCEFRSVNCMLGKDKSCKWNGHIKDWYIHGLYDHNIYAKTIDYWPPSSPLWGGVHVQYNNFNSTWVEYNMLFKIENEHFILFSEKSKKDELCIYTVYLPSAKPSKDYSFRVEFLKGYESIYKLSLKATPLLNGRDVVMARMSLRALNPLVDSHGNLRIYVTQEKKSVKFQS